MKIKCSNCGKYNKYTNKELKEVFPYSREMLICKVCNKHLSICGWFIEQAESKTEDDVVCGGIR